MNACARACDCLHPQISLYVHHLLSQRVDEVGLTWLRAVYADFTGEANAHMLAPGVSTPTLMLPKSIFGEATSQLLLLPQAQKRLWALLIGGVAVVLSLVVLSVCFWAVIKMCFKRHQASSRLEEGNREERLPLVADEQRDTVEEANRAAGSDTRRETEIPETLVVGAAATEILAPGNVPESLAPRPTSPHRPNCNFEERFKLANKAVQEITGAKKAGSGDSGAARPAHPDPSLPVCGEEQPQQARQAYDWNEINMLARPGAPPPGTARPANPDLPMPVSAEGRTIRQPRSASTDILQPRHTVKGFPQQEREGP